MKITIVGLGLIGGSMARAISLRTKHEVFGIDTDPETIQRAIMAGAIDAEGGDGSLADSDLVLLALTPDQLVGWAREKAQFVKRGAALVDLCGVKRMPASELEKAAREYGFRYVGGHPMAGIERWGFAYSRGTMFDNASMILTPNADADIVLLDTLKQFFLSIGFGRVTFSDYGEHDRIIAYTSQLAHVVSSAYIKSPDAQRHMGFSAGSFKDMTRVAHLNENMWCELFLANADYLGDQLEIFIENLKPYAEALKNKDAEKLTALLREGRLCKASSEEEK